MPSHHKFDQYHYKEMKSSSLAEPLTPGPPDVEKAPGSPTAGTANTNTKNSIFIAPINMKAPKDMIPASQLPETENPSYWESHPGKKGTYLGFALVIIGMVASVVSMKYAPENVNSKNWLSDCPNGFEVSCKANSAVLRFSFALSLLFALQFLVTVVSTKLYDSYWTVKTILFAGLCALFFYVDASIFDANGYAWFARIAGFFFVMLQQVILLDFALSWNSHLMKRADDVGGVEIGVLRNKWLLIILIVSISLFAVSFSAIGVMFHFFAGCSDTNGIISISFILSIFCTVLQLFSQEGSILTSSIMTSYFTYVCFSAITLNPKTTCNPTLAGSAQTLSAAIGMAITLLSLIWTTHSTIIKIPASLYNVENANPDRSSSRDSHITTADMTSPQLRSLLQEISIIFILISSYYAMVLTNWATLQADFNMASAKTGEAAMWLQASSIWVAALFYAWRLIAPRLFPDREF